MPCTNFFLHNTFILLWWLPVDLNCYLKHIIILKILSYNNGAWDNVKVNCSQLIQYVGRKHLIITSDLPLDTSCSAVQNSPHSMAHRRLPCHEGWSSCCQLVACKQSNRSTAHAIACPCTQTSSYLENKSNTILGKKT